MKPLSKCPPLAKILHTSVVISGPVPIYYVNFRQCTRAVWKQANRLWSRLDGKHTNQRPFQRLRGPRGRKDALLKRRVYLPCEHDWEYKEDDIGDPGVINGTYTECYLRCCGCGAEKAAAYNDRPDYDDYGPEDYTHYH